MSYISPKLNTSAFWEFICDRVARLGYLNLCNFACNSLAYRIDPIQTDATVLGIACGFYVPPDRATSYCVFDRYCVFVASGSSCVPACASPTTSACGPRSRGADRGTCDPLGRARTPSRRLGDPHPRPAETAGPCAAARREHRTGERKRPRPRR